MSKIKIIGIDFSGIKVLNEFIKFSNLDFDSITISLFNFELDSSNAKIKINAGKNESFGLDGGSPKRSERLAKEWHDEIFSALNGAKIIICISDFLGDDGEGISPVISDIAREIGATIIFFAIIPTKGIVPLRRKNIEEFLKKLTEKTEYIIQIDFWYFTKFIISPKLRWEIFMEMCERLTCIDIDYFLKNYLKWTEKICELQRGTLKD